MGSPLFHGKYPDIMRQVVDANSEAEGLDVSRLPILDEYWAARINGKLLLRIAFHKLKAEISMSIYFIRIFGFSGFESLLNRANFTRERGR